MGNLSERLIEEMNAETVFTIPVFGGIEVAESVVVTWIIIALLLVLSLIFTRNLKVENPSKIQLGVETVVTMLQNIVRGSVGEHGERYVPYLTTVLIYIGLANIFGIFGFKPPTKDMNVTAALAIRSIILIQAAAIHSKGTKGWLKNFAEPVAVVTPINILELVIRPLSLCMRLFGNVLGAFVVMKLIESVVPVIVPTVFGLYFDFFDGFIQAYIFVFLSSLFIREAIE